MVADDSLMEGTASESRVLEGCSDAGRWRGVSCASDSIIFPKNCCVWELSSIGSPYEVVLLESAPPLRVEGAPKLRRNHAGDGSAVGISLRSVIVLSSGR